jgi:hypothetical protein
VVGARGVVLRDRRASHERGERCVRVEARDVGALGGANAFEQREVVAAARCAEAVEIDAVGDDACTHVLTIAAGLRYACGAMKLEFKVGDATAQFNRNWFTGKATLRVRETEAALQHMLDPSTHFSVSLTKQWRVTVEGHSVVIEKTRPVLFAGFRPQAFRVLVDGKQVAEATGY